MIRADESVDVRRDVDSTFAELSAIERYPDWLPGVVGARQTSDGPLAVGTTFSLQLAGPTGPIEASGEVTKVEAPRLLSVRAAADQGNVAGGFELDEIDDGCRVRVWMELELRGVYRFAEGLARRELEASMPAVLDRLRTRLEAGTPR